MSRHSISQYPSRRALSALAFGLMLSGCAVGPDFERPKVSPTAGYDRAPVTAAGDQRIVSDLDVPAQWWTLFHSPQINRLVEQAIAANPDLKSAQAALRATHELLAAQHATLFPELDGGFTASRQRNPATLASPLFSNANDYSLYTGQLTVAYTIDVFGGVRRQIETAAAQDENQKYTVEAAYLTLTSNVALAAIQVAALRAQIVAAQTVIDATQKVLGQLALQRRLGQAGKGDVAAQETLLAQARAALPPLRKQLGQEEHMLAQLTGRTPAEFEAEAIDLNTLQLPSQLPLTLPAKLVDQRPDIRAAEANLHAASAQVGVAIAARLPNITLGAATGGTSTELGTLLSEGNGLWSVTGGITAPIFDFGALRHKQHAAEAQFDQAKEQYRSTVLTTFQNVADVLLALQEDAAALKAGEDAEQAAKKSLDIAKLNLQNGEGNTATMLTAEQAYEQSLSSLVQAQAARYSDTTALFQALGGGWWNRGEQDLAANDAPKP